MAATATEVIRGHAIRSPAEMEAMRSPTPVALPGGKEARPLSRNADLPRSASYTYMPEALKEQHYAHPNIVTFKGSFSDADLIAPSDQIVDISPPDSSGWTTPEEPEQKVPTETSRDLVAELQRSPKIRVERQDIDSAKTSIDYSVRDRSTTNTSIESVATVSTAPSTHRPRLSASTSYRNKINRRSWLSTASTTASTVASTTASAATSRSPSPVKGDVKNGHRQHNADSAEPPPPVGKNTRKKSFLRRKSTTKEVVSQKDIGASQTSAQGTERPSLSRRSTLKDKLVKPGAVLFRGQSTDDARSPPVPPVPKLPKSFSTDRLPTYKSATAQYDRAAPMPRLLSNERSYSSANLLTARKKDELWGVFRALEGDYAKFSSKSVAFKASVVRTTLLPFLRTYASHASNNILRPEDLDRRANILNKWWTGLIEMLHGRNNQSISGTDRPAILDGISGIMERPEWRLAPSPFCPLSKRPTVAPNYQSTTSLSSNASGFLADSVHHNVRNIFVQNLSSQMAFVVDKMSLRNASASLVAFCGKACAYAFMFVPGMADVLVRLWDLPADTLRRVLSESGIGKFDSVSDISENVLSVFPPALQNLGFTSLTKLMRKLRTPPPLPLGTNHVQWWGYWLERWTGRESDLFYVFCKYFHILVTDFLPDDASKKERMCVPGLVLVHAQILFNLDSTIHRDAAQNAQDASASNPAAVTFDDVLGGETDAVASVLPVLPANATRLMAENRLIMLIRDFLSERASEYPAARQLFAESFNNLLQTAARGTSVFDHAACYTLLDLLEEALTILVRFEHLTKRETPLINSDFWQTVCKKMLTSENTLTEIRLYAFLYTVWNTVVCDQGRKADLCTGLLLDPQIFESRFNHWCPMVRAYYMRLLCWRVGRYDGQSGRGDLAILEVMHERLQTIWSHYLWQRDHAVENNTLLPPTNPCNPAPSRRLLIIRTDTQINPGSAFLTFDGLIPPTPTAPLAPNKRFSTLSPVVELDSRPMTASTTASTTDSDMTIEPVKGLRGFLRNMMGGGSNNRPRSKSQSGSKSQSSSSKKQQPAEHTDSAIANPMPAPPLQRSATDDGPRPRALDNMPLSPCQPQPIHRPVNGLPHRNFSFKFSLDFHPNAKAPGQMRLFQPRLPMTAQQHLNTHSPKVRDLQVVAQEPTGGSTVSAKYCGRALAEWMMVVGECQSFFERRMKEGVPETRFVETPALGVEVFRRPG